MRRDRKRGKEDDFDLVIILNNILNAYDMICAIQNNQELKLPQL